VDTNYFRKNNNLVSELSMASEELIFFFLRTELLAATEGKQYPEDGPAKSEGSKTQKQKYLILLFDQLI
jgi:hypothetical protein